MAIARRRLTIHEHRQRDSTQNFKLEVGILRGSRLQNGKAGKQHQHEAGNDRDQARRLFRPLRVRCGIQKTLRRGTFLHEWHRSCAEQHYK